MITRGPTLISLRIVCECLSAHSRQERGDRQGFETVGTADRCGLPIWDTPSQNAGPCRVIGGRIRTEVKARGSAGEGDEAAARRAARLIVDSPHGDLTDRRRAIMTDPRSVPMRPNPYSATVVVCHGRVVALRGNRWLSIVGVAGYDAVSGAPLSLTLPVQVPYVPGCPVRSPTGPQTLPAKVLLRTSTPMPVWLRRLYAPPLR